MKNFTPEMIEKAKSAKSAEELLALAKENGLEITAEEAELYLKTKEKVELSDDELDNVSGGMTEWNTLNLQLQNGATSTNSTMSDALMCKEEYCTNCKKNTVFYFPKFGTAYCSVCSQVLVGVVEAPIIAE